MTTSTILKTSGFWPRVRARALRAPVFLGSLPHQTGRCAPPSRPSQLRYIYNLSNLGRPRQGLFSIHLDHRGYEKGSPLPPRPAHRSFTDPSSNIFEVKLCTDATRRPNFFGFSFFYSFRIFSVCYSLLFRLSFSFSFSSYSSLLILLFLFFS